MPALHASRADIALLANEGASQSGMGRRGTENRSPNSVALPKTATP